MLWFCLAPGPSMSAELAERVRGQNVCVVGNTYELAPWADVLVANDPSWWRNHPKAIHFKGRKFSTNEIRGVEKVAKNTFGSRGNSGVLALDVVRNLGASRVVLLGYDQHGTHFFGKYTNGCANTTEFRRKQHLQQFKQWRQKNPNLDVVNATEGSALKIFPMARLDEICSDVVLEGKGLPAGACQRPPPDVPAALA